VSEWEPRERREREEEREAESEDLGAPREVDAGEELPLPPPTPSVIASADKDYGMAAFPLLLSFVISFVRFLFSSARPGRSAKGEPGKCRHRADSGRENLIKCTLTQSR